MEYDLSFMAGINVCTSENQTTDIKYLSVFSIKSSKCSVSAIIYHDVVAEGMHPLKSL